MNQPEFNLLVVNTMAIANEVFAAKCHDLVSAMAEDESNSFSFDFDEDDAIDPAEDLAELQEALDSGYDSADEELHEELDEAWEEIDRDQLNSLYAQMPAELPALTQKVTATQLKQWVDHVVKADAEHPFNAMHQLVMTTFQGGPEFDLEDEVREAIEEAVAFDKIERLREIEDQITPQHIALDDLVNTGALESFEMFELLLTKAELDDKKVVKLLSAFIDEYDMVFEKVYHIVSPTAEQHEALYVLAKEEAEPHIVEFLATVKVG